MKRNPDAIYLMWGDGLFAMTEYRDHAEYYGKMNKSVNPLPADLKVKYRVLVYKRGVDRHAAANEGN